MDLKAQSNAESIIESIEKEINKVSLTLSESTVRYAAMA